MRWLQNHLIQHRLLWRTPLCPKVHCTVLSVITLGWKLPHQELNFNKTRLFLWAIVFTVSGSTSLTIRLLVSAFLLKSSESKWSEQGKQLNHYRLGWAAEHCSSGGKFTKNWSQCKTQLIFWSFCSLWTGCWNMGLFYFFFRKET